MIALGVFAWRGAGPGSTVRELYVFGSLSTIEVVAPRTRARAALDEIERTLNERHREWHPWQASALTELNAALARGEAHRTVASIRALIEAARPHVAASGGRFDPAAGALVALWGFHTSDYPVRTPAPPDEAIAAWLAARPDYDGLVVRADGAVASSSRAMQLDFNAIAEGMAAREIASILEAHGIADALVVLGGDVHARGTRGRRPWRVAIRDPDDGVLASVELGDGESIFSSGAYGRYREDGGARSAHVLDPRSGRPGAGARASAVLTRDPVRADAAATALLVSGPAEWRAVAASMGIDCALVVDDAGVVHATRALSARIVLRTARRVVVSGEDADCG